MKEINVILHCNSYGYSCKLEYQNNIRVISKEAKNKDITDSLFLAVNSVNSNTLLNISCYNKNVFDYIKFITENIEVINKNNYKTKDGSLYKNWSVISKIYGKIKIKNINLNCEGVCFELPPNVIVNEDRRYVETR
jgi:hypothetical protein